MTALTRYDCTPVSYTHLDVYKRQLLHKPSRTKKKVPIDYIGFTIDDLFVVGYGLDYKQRYRNLPWIGVMSL